MHPANVEVFHKLYLAETPDPPEPEPAEVFDGAQVVFLTIKTFGRS